MRRWLFVGSCATLVIVAGTATMSTAADAAPTSVAASDAAKDPVARHKSFVALWNDQKYDELLDFYAEDAVLAPPNHDVIRGNQAIVAYIKTVRPLFGAFKTGMEPYSVLKDGKITSILAPYEFTNGVRLHSSETYERQSDGRYKLVHDQAGLRDPLK
ncbi:MAG: YybH family protein [Sporichthyaceae bacterium]